ncbi:three-helix bundle dimerization domain-containing protein [Agromyces bauzanensis]
MHIEEEARALDRVVDRLAGRFPGVTRAQVAAIVAEEHLELEGNPIRDFVPVLVEHEARERLRASGAALTRIGADFEADVEADVGDVDRLERAERRRDELDPSQRLGLLNGDLGGS